MALALSVRKVRTMDGCKLTSFGAKDVLLLAFVTRHRFLLERAVRRLSSTAFR